MHQHLTERSARPSRSSSTATSEIMKLSRLVAHDHIQSAPPLVAPQQSLNRKFLPNHAEDLVKRSRDRKQARKIKLEKAHSLVSERGVSATAVSKRLKVPLSSVLKLRKVRKEDLDQALE